MHFYPDGGILFKQSETCYYWKKGAPLVYHYENGPAYVNGENQFWYFNGKLHRNDGPAVSTSGKRYEWWVHGMRHRLYAPAIIFENDQFRMFRRDSWFIKGEDITNEIIQWIEDSNLPIWREWTDDHKMLFKITWL